MAIIVQPSRLSFYHVNVFCTILWSWAERKLRELENDDDSFEIWRKKLLKAVAAYTGKAKLVGSMARKCRQTLERSGGPIDD